MGKSGSSKTSVTEYRMSMHIGVGAQLDGITDIWLDDKKVWSGDQRVNSTLTINKPELFGGQLKEGGFVGNIDVLLGAPTQKASPALAQRYRRPVNRCPAFRDITTLFFYGNNIVSTGNRGAWTALFPGWAALADDDAIYSAPQQGALFKMNSAFIAQKLAVGGWRAPKGLNPAYAMIGKDANPIGMIYECLVNDDWGMGGAPDLVNKGGFEAAALRIYNESFGLSVWWMRQTEIRTFIGEILDHIQATLFLNPNTGLLDIALLRDDYDFANLRAVTPLNATLTNFKRRSSGEILNELAGTYTNPENEQPETVTVQDIASIANQDGQKVSGTRPYYMIRRKDLLTEVLARDLRSSTAPLVSAEAKLDRSFWDLIPGEVVRLEWPKRTAYALAMRVGKVSYGKPRDSAIKASLVQDVFSLEKPPFVVAPGSGWTNPAADPAPLTMQLFTLPAYFVRNAALQNDAVDLQADEALAGVLADSETEDSLDYDLVSSLVTASGDTLYTTKGSLTLTPLAFLIAAAPASVTTAIPVALFPIPEEAPKVGGFVVFGFGDDQQEFALVTAQTETGWTVARGALDTVPRAWPAGTPLWCVNPGARIADSQTIHAVGETATYRGIDRTSIGVLDFEDAPPVQVTLSDRAFLPLRPANVKVNGVGFGPVPIGAAANIDVTWATRNRLLEDSQALDWTTGPVTPEYRQETVVRFLDFAGALIVEYDGFWDQNGYSFPAAYFDKYASVTVEVVARRDGIESLTGHRITITGLPGDIGAPLPGPGIDPTNPPSYIAAPAVGAYEITGGSTFGGEVQTLLITGTPDNRDASHLLIRYRVAPGPDDAEWIETGPYFLDHNRQTHSVDIGLLAKTNYEVEVAYIVGGVPSRWRNIGQIVTGGIDAQDLLDRLDGVEAITATVQQGIDDLEEVFGDTVSAAESALAAGDAANLAALKAQEADGSASASNVSAGIASTKADEAGSSASAANAAKVAAESAHEGAGGSATAAATSASNASTSATNAGQSASAASGSATAAGTAAGNAQTFASQASNSAAGANTAAISSGVSASTAREVANSPLATSPGTAIDSFGVNQWSTLNATANLRQAMAGDNRITVVNGALRFSGIDSTHIHTAKATARPANHRFKVAASYRRVVDAGSPSDNHVTLFFWGWDAAGNETSYGEVNYHNPSVAEGVVRREVEVTLTASTAWVRAMLRVNSTQGVTEVLSLETIDGEGQIAAAASAAIAVTQAASASAAANSASISANLAASVTNRRPNLMPNGSAEQGLAGNGQGEGQWGGTEGMPRSAVSNFWGPQVLCFPVNVNDIQWIRSPLANVEDGRTYTVSCDTAIFATNAACYGYLDVVGLNGAGAEIWNPGALAAHVVANRDYSNDAPIGPVSASFTVPAGVAKVYFRWIAVGGQSGGTINAFGIRRLKLEFGSSASAYTSEATDQAISAQLGITAAVAADAQTRLANVIFEVIGAAGGDPFQLLFKAVGSNSLGQMVASALRFGNVIGGQIVDVMKLIGGSVFITGPLYIGPNKEIELNPLSSNPHISIKVGTGRMAFGRLPNDNLIYWFGPTQEVAAMRKNNATEWRDTQGRAYFGGSILAGTISNSVQGSNSLVGVSATLGPFATNGGPITIAWSYDLTHVGSRFGNQEGTLSGSTAATVRLYRRIGAAAETLIDTMVVSGSMSAQYDGEPIPGQPAGTMGQTFFQEYMTQSRTYSDNAGGTAARTYRIAVESRSLTNISGQSNGQDGFTQRYGIVSSE